jgi:DNA-binding response OmpR family regulator
LRSFARSIQRLSPQVVVARHKLEDGYSDDVIATLGAWQVPFAAKIIVLAGAGMVSAVEGRQVALGADCVLRDPVRTEVLVAYLRKYLSASITVATVGGRGRDQKITFAGATLNALERTLQRRGQTALLTPREVALVELLARSAGNVVTYDALYSEILDRQFGGDTSNMRVLLGKLCASA